MMSPVVVGCLLISVVVYVAESFFFLVGPVSPCVPAILASCLGPTVHPAVADAVAWLDEVSARANRGELGHDATEG
jgi:hypothetical protein